MHKRDKKIDNFSVRLVFISFVTPKAVFHEWQFSYWICCLFGEIKFDLSHEHKKEEFSLVDLLKLKILLLTLIR